MSNDISPSRLPPVAMTNSQPVTNNQPVTNSQPVTKLAEIEKNKAAVALEQTPEVKAKAKPEPSENRRALEETTEHLNQKMRSNNHDLNFSVDDVANKVVVVVKNKEGEIVRQIPDETALRVAHNLDNIKGLMQDEKS